MRKRLLILAVVLLGTLLIGGTVLANVVPKTQSGDERVDVLFTPLACDPTPDCTQTYGVFRNTRADDRAFSLVGTVTIEWDGDTWDTTVESAPGDGDSFTTVQPDINSSRYLVFRDRDDISNYEEYYYAVTYKDGGGAAANPADNLQTQYGRTMNDVVVVSAFPPNQTRHGSYTEFTGACTGCHGLHSAQSNEKLLKGSTATDLCATCHDGSGSKYDEYRGMVYLETATGSSMLAPAPAGPFGSVLSNEDELIEYASSAHPVYRTGSAEHRINAAPGSGFGSAATNNVGTETSFAPIGWNNVLSCVSCHEPHNKAQNFRLLRNDINDRTLGDGDVAANLRVRGVSVVNTEGISAGGPDTLWPAAYGNQSVSGTVYYSQTKLLNDTSRFCSQCHRAFYNNSIRTVDERALWRMTEGDQSRVDEILPFMKELLQAEEDKGASLTESELTGLSTYATAQNRISSSCSGGGGCHYIGVQLEDGTNHWLTAAPSTPKARWVLFGRSTGNAFLDTDAGASLANVPGSGHRHPVDIAPTRLSISEKIIEGSIVASNVSRGRDNTTIFTRIKDGPVNVGMHLEGAINDSTTNNYNQNKVVCLTCHMAHGSRVAAGDPAWESEWFVGDINLASAYYGDTDTPSGYSSFGDAANTTKLARFAPFASVCYRCHSNTATAQ